jgi:RNA polymerase sigma-70 factor (ECF subfamily)
LRNRNNRARLLREQRAVLDLQALFCSPELRAELVQVLERMPEQLAHVAIYYFVDELPHRDIARILGCSSRHVGDLVQRVLQWASRQEPVVCSS